MNAQHVSEATMRVRDVVYAWLLRWQGTTITEPFARSEANGMGMAIVEALAQLAEESKPPPVRFAVCDGCNNVPAHCTCTASRDETMDEHAKEVIR